MGDPGALAASSQDSSMNLEESTILDFLRNKPAQRAEILKYIGMTKGNCDDKNGVPISVSTSVTDPGFFVINTQTMGVSKTAPSIPLTTTNHSAPQGGLKRVRSPSTPEKVTASQQARQSQARGPQATESAEPGDKRLTVILGTSLPTAVKKDRKELVLAVKSAAPTGVKLGEIRLTKNDDVLVSCLTPHDHNACLRTDKWTQIPHTFVPRFNLSASNNDIVYIKSVPTELDISIFDALLKEKNINYSNLERVKTGKDRSDSLTLRLLIHDKRQKDRIIKEGLLYNHKMFKLEPHIKTTIKQCYRCLDYGHLVADCTGTQCCTRCGGQHLHKDCPTDHNSPSCANCAKDDKILVEERKHAASDRGCPTRIRLLREARRLGLKNPKPTAIVTPGPKSPVPQIASRTEFPTLIPRGFDFAAAAAGGGPSVISASATTEHVQGNSQIFGEPIINPRLLEQTANSSNYSNILSTVLEVVSDALGEILHEIPGVNRTKIGDSILRSVGRQNDSRIDLAAIARKVMKDPDVAGGAQAPMMPTLLGNQTQLQTPGWVTALSNKVIDDAFKKPYAPQTQQQKVNPPKPKRQYTKKKTIPPGQRQRTVSETGSDCSAISISSANSLSIRSNPMGQSLATACGASPLQGRQSAPLSPTSSLLTSPGASQHKTAIFGDESQMESDGEVTSLNSTLDSSLMKILQASDPQLAADATNQDTASDTDQTANATAAAVATNPLARKPVATREKTRKLKSLTVDSKPDG